MKKLTPLRAIRQKCLECSGYNKREVKECFIPDCDLFPFRFGKLVSRKGIGSVGNFSKDAVQVSNVLPEIDRLEKPHSSAGNIAPNEN
jgi:hypothetical protein